MYEKQQLPVKRAATNERTNPRPKKKKKKRIEWSKAFATAIAGLFGAFGVWATVRYYQLVELAINEQSVSVPDASVAATCISVVIASLMSYLLYQAGLKNSRNKYGIDSDGQPYRRKDVDSDEHDNTPKG